MTNVERRMTSLIRNSSLVSRHSDNPTVFAVVTARGRHPFPFRTRQLRLSAPMILRGQLRGKVGSRRDSFLDQPRLSELRETFKNLENVLRAGEPKRP